MTSLAKNGLTIIGLILIAVLGYYLFVIKNDSDLSSERLDDISDAERASAEFLRDLNLIRRFELPDSIFSDQRFRSLSDFSLPVQPDPVGRNNPFAPVQ